MEGSPTPIDIDGRQFTCMLGSDVGRDGMYLELSSYPEGIAVLEIFYSDETGTFSLSTFDEGVPLSAVEWLIERAKKELPTQTGS